MPDTMASIRPKKRRPELTEEQKNEIKDAFDLFDGDKDGYIDYHELKVSMRALGFDMKKSELLRIMKEYDPNDHDRISFQDFFDVVKEKVLNRDPEEEIRQAFKLFDDDGTGKISLKNMRRVARELGEGMNDEELQAMIDEFDRDGDGEINFEEFLAIMTSDY
eukprot:Clim_evm3s70 gene=Clim_evmTU3s70